MNISKFFIDRPIFAGVLSCWCCWRACWPCSSCPSVPEVVPPSVVVRQYPAPTPGHRRKPSRRWRNPSTASRTCSTCSRSRQQRRQPDADGQLQAGRGRTKASGWCRTASRRRCRACRRAAPPTLGDVPLQLNVNARGRLQTEEEFRDIILKTSPDGAVTHLSDVARVELDAQEYGRARCWTTSRRWAWASCNRRRQRAGRVTKVRAAMAELAQDGYSINALSLFGMVLAIGIVVDDAIVVVKTSSATSPPAHARGDLPRHAGSERPHHRHRADAVRGVRAAGLHDRPDRAVLQAVRHDHRHLDGDLGLQLAALSPALSAILLKGHTRSPTG